MSYVLPTIPDFKAQFRRDFPFATPLASPGVVGATASASVDSGQHVTAIAVVTPGSGLPTNPTPIEVVIYGGGGIGASAQATVVSGAVTVIAITNQGIGYATAPTVYVPIGGDNTNVKQVSDFDIAGAFAAMSVNLTQQLFASQSSFTRGYNLLAAHYLCEALMASGTGLGGQAQWLTASKTAGNVTESFSIPDRVLKSPILSKLSKTTYGAQFLELISPQLIGNFKSFYRPTLP